MTCLEAQSKIIAYIERNLEKDEKQHFLNHVKHCNNCKEELNIYYTMLEGMRQMDNNLPLSTDFEKALDDRMEHELRNNRKKKGVIRSSVLLAIFMVILVGVVGYINFLNLLHADEQAKLKEKQGEYYYSETFEGYLFQLPYEEKIININIDTTEEEPSFYDKIREYKLSR